MDYKFEIVIEIETTLTVSVSTVVLFVKYYFVNN